MAGPPQLPPPPYAPGPYVHAFAITPGTAFPVAAIRGFYAGSGGNAVVTFAGDTVAVTLTGLLAGWWYDYALVSVTSYSGTGMVGLY